MILRFADFIRRDFVYQQNPDYSYILKNGVFVPVNRNDIIDTFMHIVHDIYVGILRKTRVSPGKVECNTHMLDQVLVRYSRDIFGKSRLDAKIKHLRLTKAQRENLSEYSDYGLKVNSRNPYIHRRLANLLYWFSVLKPFAIYPHDNSALKSLGIVFDYHNEYVSYYLSLALLEPFNKTLDIHKNDVAFEEFLYDLHYRNLSRSSIEFFLGNCIV